MWTDRKTEEQTSEHTDGRADRKTDMTKLILVFCSFAIAPNNEFILQFVGANMDRFPQSPFLCVCAPYQLRGYILGI